MILPPHVRGEQVVQRRDRPPPRDPARHLQPLRVLVEHRVHDVDERLVAVEQAVAAGQQVALQPALAEVLAEHLHHAPVRRQVVVAGQRLRHPRPTGDLEQGAEPVGRRLVGPHHPERARVLDHHVAQPAAEHARRLAPARRRRLHGHGVVAEVRQPQVAQQDAAVGMRARAHPQLAVGRQRGQLRQRRAVGVEQLLRPVGAHPRLQRGEVVRALGESGERHLVRAERPLDLHAVDLCRPGPALGRAQDDHRPARPRPVGFRLDLGDPVERRVQRARQRLVDLIRVVTGHEQRLVPVAAQQLSQLVLGDAREHRRIGDLVAVQVQHRKHRAVACRVDELVRVPARGQRPGLGLAVADDAQHHQVGIVERGAVGMHERVAQLAALVDRARRLRRYVARDPARIGELAEEFAHATLVARHARVELAVAALEPCVRNQTRTAVAGAGDEDRRQVAHPDRPVHVGVEQVQSRSRSPVPEQARLDVLKPQWLAQ